MTVEELDSNVDWRLVEMMEVVVREMRRMMVVVVEIMVVGI